VDRAKMSAGEARDLKPNGIGTDINRGKGRHEARPVYMPDGTASSEVKSKILNPGDNGVHRVAMLALSRIALEGSTVGIFYSSDQAAVAVLRLASTGAATGGMPA
jgi:hypothetical protein